MPAAAIRRGLVFASADRKRYGTFAIRSIFENLAIARLALGMLKPTKISCSDHEGARRGSATVGWQGDYGDKGSHFPHCNLDISSAMDNGYCCETKPFDARVPRVLIATSSVLPEEREAVTAVI